MQELRQSEYDRVRPLFEHIENSRPIVYSVIEGNNPGRIYVDRPDDPSTAVLRFAGGEIYLGGSADDALLNQQIVDLLFSELAPPGPHLLIFSFSDTWKRALDELLKDRGVSRVILETFELSPERFRAAHTGWQSRVPEGYRLQFMDRQLAQQGDPGCDILWGSIDRFVARAFGVCVLKGDEIVSRCNPVAMGDKRFEVGISTDDKYRRQGLATLAACAFIERCLAEGFLPEWGCYYNAASKALALKLGFVSKPDVVVHYVRMQT